MVKNQELRSVYGSLKRMVGVLNKHSVGEWQWYDLTQRVRSLEGVDLVGRFKELSISDGMGS